MRTVFAMCCVFALGKAFPVEENNLVKIDSTSTQTDNLNIFGHKRIPREISDYYFGTNTYPFGTNTYPYQIPSNPYYEYDVEQGVWRPKCKTVINSNYVSNGYVSPPRRRYGSRANRRQGFGGVYTRAGHSPTFEALRGAIAFGKR